MHFIFSVQVLLLQVTLSSFTKINITFIVYENVVVPISLGNVIKEADLAKYFNQDDLVHKKILFFPAKQPAAQYFQLMKSPADVNVLQLELIKTIDREQLCDSSESICLCQLDTCFLTLKLIVYPYDDIVVTIHVRIIILDRNDCPPLFSVKEFTIRFAESDPIGTRHLLPQAQDRDFGINAKVNYSMDSFRQVFALRHVGSHLELELLHSLDRESRSTYEMLLLANDQGVPSLVGQLKLIILVEDANDSPPMFEKSVYNVTVIENCPYGTVLIKVHAEDADADLNGKVWYQLARNTPNWISSLFSINTASGVITVQGNVDREVRSELLFVVIATDHGASAKSAKATVIVRVLDMNDNAPELKFSEDTSHGVTHVKENRSPNTVVTSFTVEDRDLDDNGTVHCEILKGALNFGLEPMPTDEESSSSQHERGFNNGAAAAHPIFQILTRQVFDREVKFEYTVTVLCRDRAAIPISTIKQLIILIDDENDNSPVFHPQQEVSVSILENNKPGIMIYRLNATDADRGDNAAISYSLLNGEDWGFSVEAQTGRIYVHTALDREVQSELKLYVMAADRGRPHARTTTATVHVIIDDVNDEAPRLQSIYRYHILENVDPDVELGTIHASDPDLGIGSDVTLFGGDHRSFEVSKNGQVRAKVRFDREERTFYSFLVYAKDGGGLTATATVEVQIEDVNDNAPRFVFPTPNNANFSLSFREKADCLVMQVAARDADADENGAILYSLTESSSSSISSSPAENTKTQMKLQFEALFKIEPRSGKLYTARDLHASDQGAWHLLITAKDCGQQPKLSQILIFIQIIDSNSKNCQPTQSTSSNNKNNIVIVIALGSFSGVLIVILLLAIGFVLRRKLHLCEQLFRHNSDTLHPESLTAWPNNKPGLARSCYYSNEARSHLQSGCTGNCALRANSRNCSDCEKEEHHGTGNVYSSPSHIPSRVGSRTNRASCTQSATRGDKCDDNVAVDNEACFLTLPRQGSIDSGKGMSTFSSSTMANRRPGFLSLAQRPPPPLPTYATRNHPTLSLSRREIENEVMIAVNDATQNDLESPLYQPIQVQDEEDLRTSRIV